MRATFQKGSRTYLEYRFGLADYGSKFISSKSAKCSKRLHSHVLPMQRYRPPRPQSLDTRGIQISIFRLFGLRFPNVKANKKLADYQKYAYRTVHAYRGRDEKRRQNIMLCLQIHYHDCYLISGSNPSNSGAEKNSPSVMSSPSQIILIVMSLGFRLLP